MRIISGTLKGREFKSPNGHRTHPMSEKARGAIFNALGDIEGLTVLDAFAGSGAIAFEALSRGAKEATLVELDKQAITAIKSNIDLLGLRQETQVFQSNMMGWSKRRTELQYDLVLCDPPYDQISVLVIQQLAKHVKKGGLLVLSWPDFLETPKLLPLGFISRKNYGDANLIFYRQGNS